MDKKDCNRNSKITNTVRSLSVQLSFGMRVQKLDTQVRVCEMCLFNT